MLDREVRKAGLYCSPSRILTASQWCVRLKYVWRALDLTEKEKKTYNTKPHRQSYIVCLFIYQHIDYRGLLCGFDFVTFFSLSLCLSVLKSFFGRLRSFSPLMNQDHRIKHSYSDTGVS